MNKQYYAILGLDKSVQYTYEELKNAYRKMAMKYHPDRNKDINTTDKFQKIKEAFDVLSAEIKHNEKFNLFDIACNDKHIYNELNYRKIAFKLFIGDKIDRLSKELDRLSKEIEIWKSVFRK